MSYVERVATRATEVDLGRALLTLLASPFYLIGLIVGVLWVTLAWCYAAVLTGAADVRDRPRAAGVRERS